MMHKLFEIIKKSFRHKKALLYLVTCSAIFLGSVKPEIDFCFSTRDQIISLGTDSIETTRTFTINDFGPDSNSENETNKSDAEHSFCHLGHSCGLVIDKLINFHSRELANIRAEFESRGILEPELEGPFRPPKQSS